MKRYGFINKFFYCGPPGLGTQQIFGHTVLNNVIAWFDNAPIFFVYMARTAIRQSCKILGLSEGAEVLAPAYNCGSEIDPLIKSGASVKFYRIDKSAMVDINDLQKRITGKTKVVYVTHYFGFSQPIKEIKALCIKNDLFLIEDCALSLFSSDGHKKLGTTGDIGIFNFPKTLPVPDGGALLINNPELFTHYDFTEPEFISVFRKMLPLFKSTIYRQFPIISLGNLLFNSITKKALVSAKNEWQAKANGLPDIPGSYYYDERLSNKAMSKLAKQMLQSFNVEQIITRRRENFSYFLNLVDGLQNISPLFATLPEGVCPLAFPIQVKQRNRLCNDLKRHMISAIPWWAGFHRGINSWEDFPDACFLKNNTIALPIHQDLNFKDIEFMFKTLKNIILKQEV